MSASKVVEPAFQGAGHKPGTEIWRIENFLPVPLKQSDYGKFYSGDSYIVLQTTAGKGGAYFFDIHFWIGKDTSQDEAGTAAIKTVELDAVLGGRAVQHREIQGHESDKFLSYFKPCIIPLEGGVASGFRKTEEEEEFETRLYVCKGKRVVKLKQVPFARSSLNHDDVFILDTKNKIYQFNGENSSIQERAKALEVIQSFKEKYHDGTCDVAIVDDGNLVAESDSSKFWIVFGGFAPIGKKAASEDDIIPESTPAKLFCIADGQVTEVEGSLTKSLLENDKCYLLDCGAEVFVWVGRLTQLEERKGASQVAEEFLINKKRPKATRITRVIQGYEPHSFKANFDTWPSDSAASVPEEGRGKVAALLKQQGVGIKGAVKGAPVNEEVPPLLEGGGKTEVWRINGSAKTPISTEDVGKFYSGDCYIVLYTYHSGEKREEYFLCYWIGRDSSEDDKKMALLLTNTMFNSLNGRPVQGRIFQGKEPPQFVAIFQPMVVLKGGLSAGYKRCIADKGLDDQSYNSDSVALIRISGVSLHNNKATQVETAATSLNSNECFILQSGSSVFLWHGNQSTYEQQQLAAKVAEFLKPGVALKHAKEGTESSTFWYPLGGKQSYVSKKIAPEIIRDPHLFTYSFNKGKFQIQEVYNFTQDDLLTEDLLILDTHGEVFVWVGRSTDTEEKQSALEIGQKYIDLAASLDGLSAQVPSYKTMEGNEPSFFTTYFSWDNSKAAVQGNSFQKKVALLFGTSHAAESPGKSNGSNQAGPTQRASALAALSSAFEPASGDNRSTSLLVSSSGQGSQRAAAVAALSADLSAEKKNASPGQSGHSTPSNTPPAPRISEEGNSDNVIARDVSEELEEAADEFDDDDYEDGDDDSEDGDDDSEDDDEVYPEDAGHDHRRWYDNHFRRYLTKKQARELNTADMVELYHLPLEYDLEDLTYNLMPNLAEHWKKSMNESSLPFLSLFMKYKDVFHHDRGNEDSAEIVSAYLMHTLNHIMRMKDIVASNDRLLEGLSEEDGFKLLHTRTLTDRQLARSVVLILLPLRSIALEIVERVVKLTPTQPKIIFNMPRPSRELGRENNSDDFVIGINFAREEYLVLYSELEESDLIIASPGYLKKAIDERKATDYLSSVDYLSAVEVLIVDHADMMSVKDWEHVDDVFASLNHFPTFFKQEIHRTKRWSCKGLSRFYRQTILVGSYKTPAMELTFDNRCFNYQGKLKLDRDARTS